MFGSYVVWSVLRILFAISLIYKFSKNGVLSNADKVLLATGFMILVLSVCASNISVDDFIKFITFLKNA